MGLWAYLQHCRDYQPEAEPSPPLTWAALHACAWEDSLILETVTLRHFLT